MNEAVVLGAHRHVLISVEAASGSGTYKTLNNKTNGPTISLLEF